MYVRIWEENYTGARGDEKAWDILNKCRAEGCDSCLLRVSSSQRAPRSITATSCLYHQAVFPLGSTLASTVPHRDHSSVTPLDHLDCCWQLWGCHPQTGTAATASPSARRRSEIWANLLHIITVTGVFEIDSLKNFFPLNMAKLGFCIIIKHC